MRREKDNDSGFYNKLYSFTRREILDIMYLWPYGEGKGERNGTPNLNNDKIVNQFYIDNYINNPNRKEKEKAEIIDDNGFTFILAYLFGELTTVTDFRIDYIVERFPILKDNASLLSIQKKESIITKDDDNTKLTEALIKSLDINDKDRMFMSSTKDLMNHLGVVINKFTGIYEEINIKDRLEYWDTRESDINDYTRIEMTPEEMIEVLDKPSNYDLDYCLHALKSGRRANDQLMLQEMINELNE